MTTDKHLDSNRDMWDLWTELHRDSDFYDLDGFRNGRNTVEAVDLEELGDVSGRTLLHLQCHFGLDTLSLARMGAVVTGLDFSPRAIELARSLAADLGIPATFVQARVDEAPHVLSGEFDIVYTSGGVLCWLRDMKEWARIAAGLVKPGGIFYIRDFHPIMNIFDDQVKDRPAVRLRYFHRPEPDRFEGEGSYAASGSRVKTASYEWTHSMGDIVTSLAEAGLRIEYLHEFPHISFESHPWLTRGDDGMWRYDAHPESLPMMFSILARKDMGG